MTTQTVTYQSCIPLVGVDGNAYSVMGTVQEGLRRAGAPKAYIDAFLTDAMSGDYDHLLAVCVAYTLDPFGADEDDDR